MDRDIAHSVGRILADLMRDDPKLYELFRSSMQDPRQNHLIREEEDIEDL